MNHLAALAVFIALAEGFVSIPSVLADPVDVVAVDATDSLASSLNLWVGNVYIKFHSAEDELLSVGMANIKTNAPGGFYQHQYGGDFPAIQAAIDLFPSLKYDSFVTIGLGAGEGQGATSTDPDFNGAAFNPPPPQDMLIGGWFNSNPANSQGIAGGDLQVLITQLTMQKNHFAYGSLAFFADDGLITYTDCFKFYPCATCIWDLNCDNKVNSRDATIVMSAYGPNPCHPADFNNDQIVDDADRVILNAHLGTCPP